MTIPVTGPRSAAPAWLAFGLLLTALCGSALPQRAKAVEQAARSGPHVPSGAIARAPAAANEDLDVTTDTSDYCNRLRAKLSKYANPPRIVEELRSEGEQMCRDGRVRGGITRLRRALIAMRDEEH